MDRHPLSLLNITIKIDKKIPETLSCHIKILKSAGNLLVSKGIFGSL